MAGERQITFVVFDGAKMLDVAGPAEVFAEANHFGADYELSYASATNEWVTTSTGARMSVDAAIDSIDAPGTLIVAGGDTLIEDPIPQDLIGAIQRAEPRSDRTVSICTGAFVLAAAGILSGRAATTHWRHAALLARAHPDIEVHPDSIFVEDGSVFTSAGVSAGIDLALALVERDYGTNLARDVARSLVVFMQRPAGQSQYSAPLEVTAPWKSVVRTIADFVSAHPAHPYTLAELAKHAGVSQRHLSRLFHAELDQTPSQFVQRIRLDYAKSLLDGGNDVSRTAREAGYGSSESMRRAFSAAIGVSPSAYRARFQTTRR